MLWLGIAIGLLISLSSAVLNAYCCVFSDGLDIIGTGITDSFVGCHAENSFAFWNVGETKL